MSDRVRLFLDNVVSTIVNDVHSGDAESSRVKVDGYAVPYPIWVTIDTIEVPENLVISTINSRRDYSVEVDEALLSKRKVRKFWAHTNDFDGMVSGWGAAELYVVNSDPAAIRAAIVEYLRQKLGTIDRVEVRIEGTEAPGKKDLPVLVGNSDSGQVKAEVYYDFSGF